MLLIFFPAIQGKNRAMLDSNPDEEDDEDEDEDGDIRPSKRAKKANPPVVLVLDDEERQMVADLMDDATGDAGLDQGGALEDEEDTNGKVRNGGEDSEGNPDDDGVVVEDEDEDGSPILSQPTQRDHNQLQEEGNGVRLFFFQLFIST